MCVCVCARARARARARTVTVGRVGGASKLSLSKIFACLFGDCALVNTILGIVHLLYCTPPCCILQSTLRIIWFPPAPPVLSFNIPYHDGNGNIV